MKSVQLIDCWRASNKFSWNNSYFIVVKEFLYGKKILDFLTNFFEYYHFLILLSVWTPFVI